LASPDHPVGHTYVQNLFEQAADPTARACLDLAIVGDFGANDGGALFTAAEVAFLSAATAVEAVLALTGCFAGHL